MSISESVLNNQDKFVNRHIGPDEVQVKEMLDVVGVNSLDQLINETIPSQIRLNKKLKLEEQLSGFNDIK